MAPVLWWTSADACHHHHDHERQSMKRHLCCRSMDLSHLLYYFTLVQTLIANTKRRRPFRLNPCRPCSCTYNVAIEFPPDYIFLRRTFMSHYWVVINQFEINISTFNVHLGIFNRKSAQIDAFGFTISKFAMTIGFTMSMWSVHVTAVGCNKTNLFRTSYFRRLY